MRLFSRPSRQFDRRGSADTIDTYRQVGAVYRPSVSQRQHGIRWGNEEMLGQQKEKKGQWDGKEDDEREQDRRVKKLEN